MMTATGCPDERWERVELSRLSSSLDRVADLRRRYAQAVQRLIVAGDPGALERLVAPVDTASERASAALSARNAGGGSERAVCAAHDELARLMVRVILSAR